MPKNVLHEIQYLCRAINRVEWSGILFYETTGDIKRPKDFKIKLLSILPMDKGSSAATDYELDERYINHLMDNPDLFEANIGHIHSHHTMETYFSGVDMDELKTNSVSHNFYLSLIVNNFGDFVAKVSFEGNAQRKIKGVPLTTLDGDGNEYEVLKRDYVVEEKVLFEYDCDVVSKVETISVSEDFSGKVQGIIDREEARKKKLQMSYQTNLQKKNIPATQKNANPFNTNNKASWGTPAVSDEPMVDPTSPMSDVEVFLYTLLNKTNPPKNKLKIELDKFVIQLGKEKDNTELFKSCLSNFHPVYAQTQVEASLESYTEFAELVYGVVEELNLAYGNVLAKLEEALKVMIDQLYNELEAQEESVA